MHRIGYSGGIQWLVTSNPCFSVDINSIIDGKRNDDDDDDLYCYVTDCRTEMGNLSLKNH